VYEVKTCSTNVYKSLSSLMWAQVGKLAGQLVSAAFPAVMDLKFERVCQPFMMLHVNRFLHPALRLSCLFELLQSFLSRKHFAWLLSILQ